MTILTMLRVPVDLNALARYADDRSWTERSNNGHESDAGFDEGRALHHVLDEAFGPGTLRPFRWMAARDATHGAVYAYWVTCPPSSRPCCCKYDGSFASSFRSTRATWSNRASFRTMT
ncbi:MAG: hypothetical protein ABL901_05395 [Hyphomicrobiaceae bacterium]